MVTPTRISKEEFAFRFIRAFDAKKKREEAEGRLYGLLTIARKVNPDKAQSLRRSLQRYRNHAAHLPDIVTRRKLADELGVPHSEFGAQDDPDDPPSSEPDAARVNRDLLAQVRALRREARELERLVLAR